MRENATILWIFLVPLFSAAVALILAAPFVILRQLFSQVAKDRQESIENLERTLASLQNREKELRDRLQALENTPMPVADHFAKLIETMEKQSAKRDFLLFVAGVIVSMIIAVIGNIIIAYR